LLSKNREKRPRDSPKTAQERAEIAQKTAQKFKTQSAIVKILKRSKNFLN